MMVDDGTPEAEPLPEVGRPKRAPPTIDLQANEVSGATAGIDSANETAAGPDARAIPPQSSRTLPLVFAAITGAVAALLVIGAAWLAGWPGASVPQQATEPPFNNAKFDDLAARLANVEARPIAVAAPAADPSTATRIDAMDKLIMSLRNELAAVRGQSEKLAAAVSDVKTAPQEAAPPPDLSAINERLAQIERTAQAFKSETVAHEAAPADDVQLRRVVAAALLDVSVRQGEPYGAMLAAAKPLAADANRLKPLEMFAASGVPNTNVLSRELLALIPRLTPAPKAATTGTGIVDRLEGGAVRLLRIERTDAGVGDSSGSIVARATTAALRNDVAGAQRELNALPPADRAAAQPWLDKVVARDAALAASRQFAADAMTALSQPVR